MCERSDRFLAREITSMSVRDILQKPVEEITLGVVCAAIVHSLIFPKSAFSAFEQKLRSAIADTRRCRALPTYAALQCGPVTRIAIFRTAGGSALSVGRRDRVDASQERFAHPQRATV